MNEVCKVESSMRLAGYNNVTNRDVRMARPLQCHPITLHPLL